MSGHIAGSSVTPADVRFSSYPQLTTALQNPYVTLSGIANPTSSYQAANKKYVDDAIAAGGGSSITVDSELSGTSTNPVQNKVINSALSNKIDKFTQPAGVQWDGLLYGVQDDGNTHSIQKMFDLCTAAIKDTVVLRNNKGEIFCETPTINVTDKHAVNIGYLTTKYGSTYYESQDKEFYLPSGSKVVIPNISAGRLFMGFEGARSTDFKIYVNDPIDNGKLIITNLKTPTNDEDAVNKKYVDNHVGNIATTEAEEHAQIDNTEIITAQTGTWVTDGWTGNATTGFTHTSGNTSILKYPITGSDYTAEGTLYDITFNCSVSPTVDNVMVRIGNSDLFNLYGQEEPLNIGVKSKGSTDGTIYLEFIPSSTFTGTISNIEVHKITGTYVGKYKITDSNGRTSFEVRADTNNKYNAFIGVDSGSYNTTGNGNAGFGYNALASNTSGFWNTGIGFEALQFVNAGSRNIGIGALAGRHIETGQRNVAIGTHSLRENRTGNYNIAIGADSQLSGKSGNSNISIGGSSLYYIDGGNENIAIGHNAIAANNTENKGNYNIAIGFNSLTYGSNSIDNIAIGRNAGYRITGSNNVVIGTDSGRRGNSQVVMGANSGKNLQDDATENTIIGYYTGNNLKANKNCILIGNRVDGEEIGDYQLNIGNLIKGSMQTSNKYVNINGSLSAKNMSVDNVGTTDTAVVNKKYVDDIKTELLKAINHPYTYDETTKELTLIL